MMFTIARKLAEKGVVGLNKRNADIILPFNARKFYPLVDDKLKTKRLAEKAGLSVPQLYGVIEYAAEVRNFGNIVAPHEQFVIKPAQGAGGEGIIVIKGRTGKFFKKSDGQILSDNELQFHIQNALGGVFSLGGQPDKVLIEYCVQFDPVFKKIAYQGVPDIRIIVFKGYPVMAMVRLPTRLSSGKANLHLGAIGAGVDIASGTTLTAVFRNDVVTEHPDTYEPVGGVQIPGWDQILEIAARTYELTGLGYQGVDIVLDENKGPLILELNARPGLNIQIANRAGLQPRLDKVLAIKQPSVDVSERVLFAKKAFAVAYLRPGSSLDR